MSKPSTIFLIGRTYKTVDLPGRNVCEYTLEWIDDSNQSYGVTLWINDKGLLHLQNIGDFSDAGDNHMTTNAKNLVSDEMAHKALDAFHGKLKWRELGSTRLESDMRAALEAIAPMLAQAGDAVSEPVGIAGIAPGTSGFTMAYFRASDVPVGTKIYTIPPHDDGKVARDAKPDFWWNGLRDENQSIGSKESTYHDIPLFYGCNPHSGLIKDAERYRWLRDISRPEHGMFYLSVWSGLDQVKWTPNKVDETIDDAIKIDAAIKEQHSLSQSTGSHGDEGEIQP